MLHRDREGEREREGGGGDWEERLGKIRKIKRREEVYTCAHTNFDHPPLP